MYLFDYVYVHVCMCVGMHVPTHVNQGNMKTHGSQFMLVSETELGSSGLAAGAFTS